MNSVIIIPALNPGPELTVYTRELLTAGFKRIMVVDDGSGADYQHVFAELAALPQVTLLRHTLNRGKGRALKTAIRQVLAERYECDGVITVDADGQHTVTDVCRVAQALAEDSLELVLGCRDFSLPQAPFRSRLGNRTTSRLFEMLYGVYLPDTQTGLRGVPLALLPRMLRIEGERFDYEMQVLVELLQSGVRFRQIPIETKYFNKNKGSHFGTLRDTKRVGRALLAGKRRRRKDKRRTWR